MSPSDRVFETANDRFKRHFANSVWIGLILATAGHAAIFRASPRFGVQDFSFSTADLAVFDLPERIEIPPAPEAIPRPATPVITDEPIASDITIPPTTFESNPVETLPAPPPRQEEQRLEAAPTFTPMTVRPELLNPVEIAQVLLRFYPTMLRDAGIGGSSLVWFFIDETGHVVRTLIHESSGYDAFDEAALRVADQMRFSPAYNRDKAVPVWVSIAIVFETVP
jgi:TonB family protein